MSHFLFLSSHLTCDMAEQGTTCPQVMPRVASQMGTQTVPNKVHSWRWNTQLLLCLRIWKVRDSAGSQSVSLQKAAPVNLTSPHPLIHTVGNCCGMISVIIVLLILCFPSVFHFPDRLTSEWSKIKKGAYDFVLFIYSLACGYRSHFLLYRMPHISFYL